MPQGWMMQGKNGEESGELGALNLLRPTARPPFGASSPLSIRNVPGRTLHHAMNAGRLAAGCWRHWRAAAECSGRAARGAAPAAATGRHL